MLDDEMDCCRDVAEIESQERTPTSAAAPKPPKLHRVKWRLATGSCAKVDVYLPGGAMGRRDRQPARTRFGCPSFLLLFNNEICVLFYLYFV